MKWLGQHIVDFIARFRSDVYLEDLTTDSSTDILVVDSNNKVCKNSGAGDDTSFDLTADSGADQTIVDGNTLTIAGGSAITTVVSATDTVTIKHDDTSSQASSNNTGNTCIQDIAIDTYGHVTTIGTTEITSVEGATLAESAVLAATATNITVADESSDTTCFPLFATAATGNLGAKSASGLTFNSATDTLTATAFVGPLTGNADTATTAATVTGALQENIDAVGDGATTFIVNSPTLYMTSLTASKPEILLHNYADDATGPVITFKTQRVDTGPGGVQDGEVNDVCGTIIFSGYNDRGAGPQLETFGSILGVIADPTDGSEAGKIDFKVLTKDSGGTGSGLETGLLLVGSDTNDEVDVTLGSGADSVVTIPGQLLAVNGGMGTSHYGNYIKLIPSDFVANDDGGNTRLGIGYVDTAGEADYGMRVSHNDTELFAFVSIPEGMKATHVEVFGRRAKAVEVFEVQINASTLTSKGTGTCGIAGQALGDEEFAIDVESTATNLLAIEVTVTSNSADKVYGGRVKIAAI